MSWSWVLGASLTSWLLPVVNVSGWPLVDDVHTSGMGGCGRVIDDDDVGGVALVVVVDVDASIDNVALVDVGCRRRGRCRRGRCRRGCCRFPSPSPSSSLAHALALAAVV